MKTLGIIAGFCGMVMSLFPEFYATEKATYMISMGIFMYIIDWSA